MCDTTFQGNRVVGCDVMEENAMRLPLVLFAAAAISLPIGVQAHEMEDWSYPGMGCHFPGMGWGQTGMMPGSSQGMGWGGMHRGGLLMAMLPMLMAMADTNGDGALSLEEHQAVHARMFNFFDTNKDGQLTSQEVQAVIGGGSSGQPTSTTQPNTTNQQ
jgi:hypothetical protein